MATDWRVSVTFAGSGAGKFHRRSRLALIQASLGEEVTISLATRHVLMYAGNEEAAEAAEQVARQVLLELGLTANCRLERWEASSKEWRDIRLGLPATGKADVRNSPLDAVTEIEIAGGLIGAALDFFLGN